MSDTTDDELTVEAVLSFGADRASSEADDFPGELPNHAARLLAHTATGLLQSITEHEIVTANEELDDVGEDRLTEAIENDLVDVFMGVAAISHEYDIDIVGTLEEHMEFVRDYERMQEAVADADTQQEMLDAFDEHMGEYSEDMIEMVGDGIEPGSNVDNDEYDADDDRDRHIA
jgi:hypothetical protein